MLQDLESHKLEDLGFLGRGKSRHRPRNEPSLFGGKYPFIQTGEVKAAEFYINSFEDTYNEKGLAQSKLWKPGTLLITIAANIAETAILDMKACFPDSILGFIPDENKADVRFIKYYIDTIKLQMQNISKGTTQDNLSLQKLRSINFKVPPVSKQKRIADVLTAFDDLISTNSRRIEILEEMARRIYREWFVHFRYPGHEKDELVDSGSELGKIPEGWEVAYLGDLVSSQYGYTESADEDEVGPMFIRGTDINKASYIDWSGVPYCPIDENDYKKFKVNIGDILVVRMGSPGETAIIEDEEKAVFASYLIRLVIQDDRIAPYYLFYTMNDHKYQGFISGASTGTTRKSVSAKVIKNFDLLLPPNNLLYEFEEKIGLLRQQLNTLMEQNNRLKETRDLLLPKLISGKVDVKEITVQN